MVTDSQISANAVSGTVINFVKFPGSKYASENFTCIECALAPNVLLPGQSIFRGSILSGAVILGGRINSGPGQVYLDLKNSFTGYPLSLHFINTTIVGNQPLSSLDVLITQENSNDGARTYSRNGLGIDANHPISTPYISLKGYTFKNLPNAPDGTLIFCIDCKNSTDDSSGTFDSNAAPGGHGTNILRENGKWRVR